MVKRRSLLAPLSDPDYEELMDDKTPDCRREPNVVTLRKCPVCREWMRAGSVEAGHCIDCGTPRPLTDE